MIDDLGDRFIAEGARRTVRESRRLARSLRVSFPNALLDIWSRGDASHLGPVDCFSERDLHVNFTPLSRSWWKRLLPDDSILEAADDIRSDYRRFFRADWPQIIPIGGEGNGDFVCLDYRTSPDAPAVIKFDHEIAFGDRFPFSFLATTVDELLDRARGTSFFDSDSKKTEDDIDHLSPGTGALSLQRMNHHYPNS
ncbi:MAG: SMI1/KNR4 family protein [Verrucomicrobiota bacterium]